MDKDVGVILLEMLVSKGVGRVVVFVGSIILDLTSSVVHSLSKRKSLSSICIQFLATGSPLSLSLSHTYIHHIASARILLVLWKKNTFETYSLALLSLKELVTHVSRLKCTLFLFFFLSKKLCRSLILV